MENPELVQRLNKAETLLREAKDHYEMSISLTNQAFTLITSTVINSGLQGFRKDHSEKSRRLAIRGIALVLESLEKGDVLRRISSGIDNIYNTLILVRSSYTEKAKEVQIE